MPMFSMDHRRMTVVGRVAVAAPQAPAGSLLVVLELTCVSLCCLHTAPQIFQLAYSDNDACSTCKFAVRMLSDMLCDPSVDDTMVSKPSVATS